jgi:hypothetical protein
MEEYPSLFEQSKNLSKFTLDIIKHLNKTNAKNLFADDKLFNERLEICKKCEKYDANQQRCFECGCFLTTKARIILDSCPLGKWTESLENWEIAFEEMISEINASEDENADTL